MIRQRILNEKPSPRLRERSDSSTLRFSPTAWAKLLYLRDAGDTEVGGFGISAVDDLLFIEDVQLVRQVCTMASVAFDDASVADFFDRQVDAGVALARCGRVWLHTHPGTSPQPSVTDDETFARVFGRTDWAVMFVLAQGGQCYARLRFHVGPGGDIDLPVHVDYSRPFLQALHKASETANTESIRYATDCLQLRPMAALPPRMGGRPWLKPASLPVDNARADSPEQALPFTRAAGQGGVGCQKRRLGRSRRRAVDILPAVNKVGRFPDMSRIMANPDDAKARCQLSPDDMRFLAETLPKLPCDDEQNFPVTLDVNGHIAVRAKAADQAQPTEVVLSNSTSSGEPLRININRKYLTRAMRLGVQNLCLFGRDSAILGQRPTLPTSGCPWKQSRQSSRLTMSFASSHPRASRQPPFHNPQETSARERTHQHHQCPGGKQRPSPAPQDLSPQGQPAGSRRIDPAGGAVACLPCRTWCSSPAAL